MGAVTSGTRSVSFITVRFNETWYTKRRNRLPQFRLSSSDCRRPVVTKMVWRYYNIGEWEEDIQPYASDFLLSTIAPPGRSSVIINVQLVSLDSINRLTWKISIVLGWIPSACPAGTLTGLWSKRSLVVSTKRGLVIPTFGQWSEP